MNRIKSFKYLFLVPIFLVSCGTKKVGTEQNKQMSDIDSVSYSFGIINGKNFSDYINNQITNIKLNKEKVIDGFVQSLREGVSDSTLQENVKYFESWMSNFEKKQKEERELKSKQYLEENSQKEGVITTDSGLQYEILRNADGEKPTTQDTVVVDYEGRLIDGTKFDSSYDRGQSLDIVLSNVIPGWTEGIQLMPVGSKYKFTIPSELAYGDRGAGNVIPPNSVLIFDVELKSIKKYKEPQKEELKEVDSKKSKSKSRKTKK